MAVSRTIRSGRKKPTADEHERLLLAVLDFLSDRKIRCMPCFGTLLGLHRNGGVIEGDTDVDLMVLEEDEARMLWASHCLPEGLVNYRCFDPHILSLAFEGSDAYCDVYIFRPVPGGYSCGSYYRVLYSEMGVPVPFSWRGRDLMVFEDVEAYLERVYGPDWRIPSARHATS